MKVLALFLLIIGLSFSSHSQDLLKQKNLWSRIQLSKQFGESNVGILVENRQYIDPWRAHMFFTQLSVKRNASKNSIVGLHMSYLVYSLPHDPIVSLTKRKDELNLSQSFTLKWLPEKQVSSRLMLEERFFKSEGLDGHFHEGFKLEYYRIRLKTSASFRIASNLQWIVSDEFMVQFEQGDLQARFDQNRIDAIFRYHFTPALAFDLGYLSWYQERPGIRYLRHTIRTGLLLKL